MAEPGVDNQYKDFVTKKGDLGTTRAKQFCTPCSFDISFSMTLNRTEWR